MNLDFYKDDGINLPMLNDYARTECYCQWLQECSGRDVTDIGFGTGILSILADHYGATSITAYEQNKDRFTLGQTIIDKMSLNIKLINEKFKNQQSNLLIHEIVGQYIWDEGLYDILPVKEMIPSEYKLDVMMANLPRSFIDHVAPPLPVVNTGSELLNDYHACMNAILEECYHTLPIKVGYRDSPLFEKIFKTSTKVGGYHVTSGQPLPESVDILFDHQDCILFFCFSIGHKGTWLPLYNSSWDMPDCIILRSGTGNGITQSFKTGKIRVI